jgi:hypothetical protein
MTLVELLVATGIGGIIFSAVVLLMFYSARSFAALSNYVDLDSKSRNALDSMSSEIRQVDALTSYTTNQIVFRGTDSSTGAAYTLTYRYDPVAKTLSKTLGGRTTVLLQECTFMQFAIFQRNPVGGSYNQYPVDDPSRPDLCKLVQLTWVCSRSILQKSANTESVQSAKFVIRKA